MCAAFFPCSQAAWKAGGKTKTAAFEMFLANGCDGGKAEAAMKDKAERSFGAAIEAEYVSEIKLEGLLTEAPL